MESCLRKDCYDGGRGTGDALEVEKVSRAWNLISCGAGGAEDSQELTSERGISGGPQDMSADFEPGRIRRFDASDGEEDGTLASSFKGIMGVEAV